MFIQTEATPNPEVLKFLPGREVMGEGSRDFRDADEAKASALAAVMVALGRSHDMGVDWSPVVRFRSG